MQFEFEEDTCRSTAVDRSNELCIEKDFSKGAKNGEIVSGNFGYGIGCLPVFICRWLRSEGGADQCRR